MIVQEVRVEQRRVQVEQLGLVGVVVVVVPEVLVEQQEVVGSRLSVAAAGQVAPASASFPVGGASRSLWRRWLCHLWVPVWSR